MDSETAFFGGYRYRILCHLTSTTGPKSSVWGIQNLWMIENSAIAPLLRKTSTQALLLSPKKYNEVIASGYNAVSVKVALHNPGYYLLLNKGSPSRGIVIDAFTTAKKLPKNT